jgi:hypothetical protein
LALYFLSLTLQIGMKLRRIHAQIIPNWLVSKGAAATAEKITLTLPKANHENSDKAVEKLPKTDKEKTPKVPDANAEKKAGKEGDMPETPDPTAKKVEQPKTDSKGELPKDKDNTDKMASDEGIDLDPMILAKIGSMCLAVEDGRAIAMREIEKANGAAAAQDIIKAAAAIEYEMTKIASIEEVAVAAAQEMWANATPEERSKIVKIVSGGLKTG